MSTISLYDTLDKFLNERYMSKLHDDLNLITAGTRDKKSMPDKLWTLDSINSSPWNMPIASPAITDDTSWNAWAIGDQTMPSGAPDLSSIDIGNDTVIDDKLKGELYKFFNVAMPDGTFKTMKYSDNSPLPKTHLNPHPALTAKVKFSDLMSEAQVKAMIDADKAYYPVGKDIYPATMVDSYADNAFKPRSKTAKLNMQPMFNAAKEAFLILDAVYEQVVIADENRPFWKTDNMSLIDMRPLAMRAHRITKINTGIESPGSIIDTELFEDFMLIREEDRMVADDIEELVSVAVRYSLSTDSFVLAMADLNRGPAKRIGLEFIYDGHFYRYLTDAHGEFRLSTLLRDPNLDKTITQLTINRWGETKRQHLSGDQALTYLRGIHKELIDLPYGIRS